ncbi:hypothetical protein ACFLVI_02700 [Chloroflexota bacterium]
MSIQRVLLSLLMITLTITGCVEQVSSPEPSATMMGESLAEIRIIDRESTIPIDQPKITPEIDLLPPVLHSNAYQEPVPLPYPINTAGAEDSGFIMPDGNTLYLWFTPDPQAPLGVQLDDRVTGIYMAKKTNGEWQKPERVLLQDPNKQSLDGCEFVQDCTMWFCTARTGYTGIHWFTANCTEVTWENWANADFNPDYEVGELHITANGKELYFHSGREGGQGQYDVWVSNKKNGEWQSPQNVEAVNSPENDGWPSLTQDSNELWFTRLYLGSPAIFRSKRANGEWQAPELIISQFAGESSVDNEGNIYFTHHFYQDGVMLEADIYVAYKK